MTVVADHATELSLAREQIANLESIQTSQRIEVITLHFHFCGDCTQHTGNPIIMLLSVGQTLSPCSGPVLF